MAWAGSVAGSRRRARPRRWGPPLGQFESSSTSLQIIACGGIGLRVISAESMSEQLPLPLTRRGGKRAGAGRKPKGDRAGMPHGTRAPLASRFPVHITLRTVDGLSGLRSRECFRAIANAFRLARSRQTIRLTEFSVQGNHLHLIVEAAYAERLSRGMQGLAISIAKRLNVLLGRSGPVFADRYHAHTLKTPTEVAHAVAY